jgi:hypothetical protein
LIQGKVLIAISESAGRNSVALSGAGLNAFRGITTRSWGFGVCQHPQAVCGFLLKQIDRGPARVAPGSIAAAHRRFFNDPTDDVYVRALMRRVRANKATLPQKEEN